MVTKQLQERPSQCFYWNEHERSSFVGVLIDADGISHTYIDTILTEAKTFGPLFTVRVCGNWNNQTLKGWQRLLIPYGLERRPHNLVAPGKNATDTVLIINALELIYQQGIRQLCLAVADSDYTPLVHHVRDLGYKVLGIGMTQTVSTLKEACDRFVTLDQAEISMTFTVERQETGAFVDQAATSEPSLETTVNSAYDHLGGGKNVWLAVPEMEKQIKAFDPFFVPKHHGHRNLSKLVKARFATTFDVRTCPKKQNIQEMRRKG